MEPVAAAKPESVLFIEDDDDFAADLLLAWAPPLIVRRATSGQEALEEFGKGPPGLVLLDLALPHALADMDQEEGLHLLAYIRQELRWTIPVIVLSRDVSPETRDRALALGADAVLVKPVEVDDLDRVVRSLTAGRS